jgi:NAD(P)-dependent dehydrogenase (short-subunit alcohol dehydrogenase family)
MSGVASRNASVAIVGAGDFIGAAIAVRFARAGYRVFAGRRRGDQLAALGGEIQAFGGAFEGRSLDAREEDQVIAFMDEADADQPLELAVFNVGANVTFPILETTDRVFRKVWEMACQGGFLTGREAARHMLARGRGSIFFTGATASMRGAAGYAAFASAKAGLRALAQSMARELGPRNIHVAHLVIDAGVDTAFVRERIAAADPQGLDRLEPDALMNPASIAEAYWTLHAQTRDAWTFELDLRPYRERW